VHVAGFNDVPEAAYFNPPLTTVRQDFAELAGAPSVLLAAQMVGEAVASRHLVTPKLIVRKGVGR
jgi:DNA-binding LacI/PurR family transcriptional regulator